MTFQPSYVHFQNNYKLKTYEMIKTLCLIKNICIYQMWQTESLTIIKIQDTTFVNTSLVQKSYILMVVFPQVVKSYKISGLACPRGPQNDKHPCC